MSEPTPYLCVLGAEVTCEPITMVTLDRGPEDSPPAGRVAILRDPFGHR